MDAESMSGIILSYSLIRGDLFVGFLVYGGLILATTVAMAAAVPGHEPGRSASGEAPPTTAAHPSDLGPAMRELLEIGQAAATTAGVVALLQLIPGLGATGFTVDGDGRASGGLLAPGLQVLCAVLPILIAMLSLPVMIGQARAAVRVYALIALRHGAKLDRQARG